MRTRRRRSPSAPINWLPTAPTIRSARRCSISISTAAPIHVLAAIPRVGATASPVSPESVRSVRTSPVVRPTNTLPPSKSMIDFIKKGSELGKKYGYQVARQWPHAGVR